MDVPVQHRMGLSGGAQQIVHYPAHREGFEDAEEDRDVSQGNGHPVENHAAQEGAAQEHHIHGQQP